MKKSISLLFLTALLTACGSTPPNLVHSDQPILNISAEANPLIEAKANPKNAWVKNIAGNSLNLAYRLFWYDKNGVTQLGDTQNEFYSGLLPLQPQQKADIPLTRPTANSVNYRLYFYLP